jgi:hypothetical protein
MAMNTLVCLTGTALTEVIAKNVILMAGADAIMGAVAGVDVVADTDMNADTMDIFKVANSTGGQERSPVAIGQIRRPIRI